MPRTDYELAFEARYDDGKEGPFCRLFFPVGEGPCCLELGVFGAIGAQLVCAGRVDDRRARSRTGNVQFREGRWYAVRLRVTETHPACWVDDEKVIETARAGQAFALPSNWRNAP